MFVSCCAHVISKEIRKNSEPSLKLSQVSKNTNIYKGKIVIWGGEIIETVNQKDGTTILEVFERPLGWRGEPKILSYSEGRFLVLVDKYLDPYLFARGKRITVAGEIQDERIRTIGEMTYRYPVLLSKQIYLWDYEYDYPVAYYYDPWWFYPVWWWGIGFHYHYHPHRHPH
jgi:outer membrane lipoprotein